MIERLSVAIIAVGIVALIISCVGLPIVAIVSNNVALSSFAENLYRYPLPPDTVIIEKRADVGLTGNGNHCDFTAESVVRSKLTRDELDAYYSAAQFPLAGSGVHDYLPSALVYVETVDEADSLYHISLYDPEYPPGLDIRCN